LEEALRKIHKEYEKKKEDEKKPKVKKIKKKIKKRNIKLKVADPRPNLDGNIGTDDEIEEEGSDLDVGINEVLQEGWGEGNDQSGY